MKRLVLAALLSAAATPLAAAEPDYVDAIRADYRSGLSDLFLWFHKNPELSFKEVNPAARMARELRAVTGMVVTEKVGGTGVIGVMANGAGPTVLIRADMDGLPVEEVTGLPYASTVRAPGPGGTTVPVMHACGHDTHITGMVATARRLAAIKDRWHGTVIFLVQPAEEVVGGAEAMMKDGLYTRFPKPDYALAFHVASQLPSGHISASEGTQWSGADSVDIRVNGVATHGAAPQLGRDPVYIAAQIVTAMQGIIGRERGPLSPGVITVGSFHAGTKHNIIADHADLQLTVRSNDRATRDLLLAAIERTAKGIALANGAPEPVVAFKESTPVTVNDAPLARRLNTAIGSALGAGVVVPYVQKDMGAEDFAYFVAPETGVKGYYFAVGGTPQAAFDAAKAGGPPVPGHHSGLFKIDPEAAIVMGASAMTAAVLDLLKAG